MTKYIKSNYLLPIVVKKLKGAEAYGKLLGKC